MELAIEESEWIQRLERPINDVTLNLQMIFPELDIRNIDEAFELNILEL